MKLYLDGKCLNDEEIYQYVHSYKKDMISNNNSRYNQLMKLVPSGLNGLDYGCGWGAFSTILEEKGNTIIGIDQSSNEISICRYCWSDSNVKFYQKKISNFEDQSFDFVVSNQVIEHVHNPGNYLHEINRVLRSDGILIISIPNGVTPRNCIPPLLKNYSSKLHDRSHYVLNSYDKANTHIHSWDHVHFVNLLGSVGFVLDEYIPMEGVPLPIPKILTKVGIKSYYNFGGLFKNWSYTLGFRFRKVRNSQIRLED